MKIKRALDETAPMAGSGVVPLEAGDGAVPTEEALSQEKPASPFEAQNPGGLQEVLWTRGSQASEQGANLAQRYGSQPKVKKAGKKTVKRRLRRRGEVAKSIEA